MTCPVDHARLKADRVQLVRVCTYIGLQDDGDGGRFECWNCVCGSTLGVTPLKPSGYDSALTAWAGCLR